MAFPPSAVNVVTIDTGPPGPHSGFKILRVANVEGGSGRYKVTWRPICDLTEEERRRISCPLDYRDEQVEDACCDNEPPCSLFDDIATCCRSGNCGACEEGENTIYTRYRTGETDRELIVTIDNIPQFAQNFGPPCQLIFHWTLEDLETGDVMDGCCGVVFQWRVITPAPLTITNAGCDVAILADTSLESPAASTVLRITGISGGVGPYEITWTRRAVTDSDCVGTITETIGDHGIYTGNQVAVNISNIPRFYLSPDGDACTYTYDWVVRDTGVQDEFGNPIGRVETGVCSFDVEYRIVTPPALDITLLGCDDPVIVDTGPIGPHMATATLQVSEIEGGSGSYAVSWNTVPTSLSGTCVGVISAEVSDVNPAILNVHVANVPQFANNEGSDCVRGFTATVTDLITGRVETVTCNARFQFRIITIPPLDVTLVGCGVNTVVDTGTCANSPPFATRQIRIDSIEGGSGDYTIDWNPDATPSCGVGTFSVSPLEDDGQGSIGYDVTLTSTTGSSGSCSYDAFVVVTDNVTGATVNLPCSATFTATPITQCGALTASTSGCGQTVTYVNSSSAAGFTEPAYLTVTAGGGSGNYSIQWNETPVSASGTCYTVGTSQTSPTAASRRLAVQLTGITDTDDNTSDPCVRTYRYTITDTVTGEVLQGDCTVTFVIDLTEHECSLSYGSRTCGTSTVSLTNTTPATRTFSITGLAGGFPSGYIIDWSLSSSCGGRARFAATGTSTHQTTTTGTSTSAAIEFQAAAETSGSCTVTVTATVSSVDGPATRLYCGAPITCTYNVTWNTVSSPSGTLNCPGSAATLTRASNSATRTYSITGATNVTGYSWQVTGCTALTPTPTTGTASSFSVTYTASTAGAGINGSCNPSVSVILTGPSGNTTYNCTDTINYDTRPPAITITSVSNCGQTITIPGNANPRTATFATMTVNHSPGAGGPYTYEWTRSTSGACSGVVWSPSTASTKSITPTVTVPNGAGTCTATYSVRVRDSAGQWSSPVTCKTSVKYSVPPLTMRVFNSALGGDSPFTNFYAVCKCNGSDGTSGWSGCGATASFTGCTFLPSNPSCAPSPGTFKDGASGAGQELSVEITGGVPPYTVRIQNVTRTSGSFPTGECLRFGATGNGVINNSTSFPTGVLLTVPVPNSNPKYIAAPMGVCGSALFEVAGQFDIVAQDSAGNTTPVQTFPWRAQRLTGGIEP